MLYLGHNKFPCKPILEKCCGIKNKSSKKMLDRKLQWCFCGPEILKATGTFFMINLPLATFSALTYDYFEPHLGYRILMYI